MDFYPSLFLLFVILTCKSESIYAEEDDLNAFKTELKDIIVNANREIFFDMNLAIHNLKQELKTELDNAFKNFDADSDAINSNIGLLGKEITSVKSLATSTENKVQSLLLGSSSLANKTVESLQTLSDTTNNNLIALNDAINSVDGKVSSGQSTVNSMSNRIGTIISTMNSINAKVGSISTPESGCIFPFRYKGIVYNSCISIDEPEPWCGTKTDAEHNYVGGNWKYCQDDKPCQSPCKESWCSTKFDGNNNHVSGYWKVC